MQLLHALCLLGVAMAARVAPPVRDKSVGICNTDAECAKYPGTVCILINSGDFTQGKCTPNYGTRPVCRGGQAGLCPQYQTTTVGYINAQCVLVDKSMAPVTDTDAVTPSTAKPTAAPAKPTAAPLRFLLVNTTAAPVAGEDAAGNDTALSPLTPVKPQACPTNEGLSLSDPACWFNTAHKGSTISVQYQCISYDMCLQQSAWAKDDPAEKDAYCHPKGCVTGDRELCNNHGTCQGNDAYAPMEPKGYSCRCYAGYSGKMCETPLKTKECDVDCGLGGACIKRQCVCFEGFLGLDPRCGSCTSNAACENGNECDVDSGVCKCKEGFNGPTCGGKLTPCAGVKCKNGGFLNVVGTKCGCLCPKCPAGMPCQTCGGADNTDCSTCSGATTESATSGSGSKAKAGGRGTSSDASTSALSLLALATLMVLAM
ncbi:hypothetical protein SDRG_05345 [Saprolegnia diclina VS20]|uniref:EGF-like domain-containing protein n=1 Tax=Saprolegnia diclina (strain VS20) TaxID=1156394 RepID=T0RX24_SAPDV|nr:hypothetical protein SDRG_05345 [Saprolegnia diclina VS20]EQC37118.1 hypothetical protein SDRG_05345 [Saprolegnia diclina VS20]|eukprot:XP_008609280.1 hypothetical protein SDRG_05345 [Saprolegnia diclina VS20]